MVNFTVEWCIKNIFVLEDWNCENIIKDQITLNKHSINVSWRMFVHNFKKTLLER